MQYSPNKWLVKIKRNKDYMYITQHSFSTESSTQLLTEIHELKKKLSTTVKKKKKILFKINFSSLASNTQFSPLLKIKTKDPNDSAVSINHPSLCLSHLISQTNGQYPKDSFISSLSTPNLVFTPSTLIFISALSGMTSFANSIARFFFILFESWSFLHSDQISRSVVSDSLRPHELQHARPPCPSPTPGVYPNSCLLSRWCHPTISSSVIPFSSCPQSFPASGSFPVSQFFTSGDQRIEVSASSVRPMNIQDWFPLGWTGWISLQSKGLSTVFSNNTVQKHQFFGAQLSLLSNSHIHTWLLEKPKLWLDGPLLAK